MVSYSTPNLIGINITFMNSESLLKTSNRTSKFTSYFVIALSSMASKVSGNYQKVLKKWHLLLHSSIEQLFSLIILGNKDGDMSSFKFLFLLNVMSTAFYGKIHRISWFLCNTGRYFLKMVLILGSTGL